MRTSTASPRIAPRPEADDSAASSSAFWQRWQRYERILLPISQRILGEDSADAEDAVRTTLLRAIQRPSPPVANTSHEWASLIRILHNVCIDMHRYRRRFAESAASDGAELAEDAQEATEPLAAVSPEETLLAQEQVLELRAGVEALPASLRTPLTMRVYQDMSYADISAALNLTNCNVRKRVQLACDRLRAGVRRSATQLSRSM